MKKNTKAILVSLLLVVYLAILLKFIVFKDFSFNIFSFNYRYPTLWRVENNYVPLATILPYLRGDPTWSDAVRNVLGNIIPFMPFGFLLPLFSKQIPWKGVLGIAVALSLCIEILELVLRTGIFDVDDILLNTLGIMLGYWAFLGYRKVLIDSL